MVEYIEREALLKRLKFKRDTEPNLDGRKRYGLDSAISQVRKAPAVDVISIDKAAEILNELFGNEPPCDFRGIDEWLPFLCNCYDRPKCGTIECWKAFILAKMGGKI